MGFEPIYILRDRQTATPSSLTNRKLVDKVGIEPTELIAPDLQSGVTLQLHRLSVFYVLG